MFRTLAAIFLCIATMMDARADIFTFEFTGTIRSLYDSTIGLTDQTIDPLGAALLRDSAFHGTFSIDSDTALTAKEELSPNMTLREYQSGAINNTVQNNHMSVVFDQTGYVARSGMGPTASSSIQTLDSRTTEEYGVQLYEFLSFTPAPAIGAHGREDMYLFVGDETEYMISSKLPGSLQVTSNSVFNYSFIQSGTGREIGVEGQLTSLDLRSISPVPEPSSDAMLALGLLTVGAASYRQKRGG
jgi:hypothetical protein